ncbi:MAG: endolytic transglycosylase MltG [Patescibacteria group bacterium]
MKKFRRVIYFFLIILLSLLVGSYYSSPGEPTTDLFVVEDGETAESVSDRLAEQDFIRSRSIFWWELRQSGLATKLQPGQHDLSGVISYAQIIERLTSKELSAPEVVLLVREGETLRDIRTALQEIGLTDTAEKLTGITGESATFPAGVDVAINRLSQDYDWLEQLPDGASLEGFMFPDTYRFFRDASAEDVVRKLLGNFDLKYKAELRADQEKSGRTLYEVIIMASILEREVRGETDMKLVSDLFWRRYDIGMGLQADSTVNYVTGGNDPSISYGDTQLDSPYNTYRWRGLPPGPIGNPGLLAIEAAINPTPNDYLFFLTDADGVVHYGRNLDEHNRNKAEYLK